MWKEQEMEQGPRVSCKAQSSIQMQGGTVFLLTVQCPLPLNCHSHLGALLKPSVPELPIPPRPTHISFRFHYLQPQLSPGPLWSPGMKYFLEITGQSACLPSSLPPSFPFFLLQAFLPLQMELVLCLGEPDFHLCGGV